MNVHHKHKYAQAQVPSKVDRSAHAVFVFVEKHICVQTGVQTVTNMQARLGGKQRYVTNLREKMVLKMMFASKIDVQVAEEYDGNNSDN